MPSRRRGMLLGPEHHAQVAVMSWSKDSARIQIDPFKREALQWLHAVPSGGGRGKPFKAKSGKTYAPFEAVKLKAEGVKPGVSDLRLDYVVRDENGTIICPGLVIEMKAGKNTESDQQVAYQDFMRRQGFAAFTRWSWWEAALDIAWHMRLDEFAPVLVESASPLIIIRNLGQLTTYREKTNAPTSSDSRNRGNK